MFVKYIQKTEKQPTKNRYIYFVIFFYIKKIDKKCLTLKNTTIILKL